MYTTTQLAVITYLLASFGLALPTEPINPDVEFRFPAERSNIEITEATPFLEARDEEYDDLVTTDYVKYSDLVTRKDPHGGKYAPSPSTRKQEVKNINKGLSPDGKNGKQVAKANGLKYDGDSGKKEYLEVQNKGPLPEKYGKGKENSLFSQASKVCALILRRDMK